MFVALLILAGGFLLLAFFFAYQVGSNYINYPQGAYSMYMIVQWGDVYIGDMH